MKLRDVILITKALSDESRVRTLLALRGGEMCVCQIVELLQMAGSTVSKHLAILKQAGLVESRKRGRWIYYRLADENSPSEVRGALHYIFQQLQRDSQTLADRKLLKEILCCPPETLCIRQRNA